MGKRKETAREKREKILAQKQAKYQQKEKERNEEAQKRLEEQRKEAEKKEIQALIQSLNLVIRHYVKNILKMML